MTSKLELSPLRHGLAGVLLVTQSLASVNAGNPLASGSPLSVPTSITELTSPALLTCALWSLFSFLIEVQPPGEPASTEPHVGEQERLRSEPVGGPSPMGW